MKGKQISLTERIRRIDQGIAADESALVNAIQRFAALPLEDFFLDPEYYSKFMELAEQMHQDFGLGEIHTYLDAVRQIAFCMRSDDEKLLKTGHRLLYDVSTNYIDMYVVLRGLNDDQYRESMHDVVREKIISAKPFAWRLGNIPSGKITRFPALYLPTNQLYQGASIIAGNDQPDKFYREMVLPCIGSILAKQTNLENTVASIGYYGGVTATRSDDDEVCCAECTQTGVFGIPLSINEKNSLIWYIAIMPYVLSFGERENAI